MNFLKIYSMVVYTHGDQNSLNHKLTSMASRMLRTR